MQSIALETIIILGLILANGLLAMAEIAVVSARKARLQQRAEEGDEKAREALTLAQNPDDFLSAVQVGITLVGVLAGAFGGATLAETIATWLRGVPYLAPYSEAIAVVLVVLAITYFSLIFGELAPKRLALRNPERTAAALARPMLILSRITSPVVRFLSLSTSLALRLVGQKLEQEPPITQEEIKLLIQQGTQAGVFEAVEQDMVQAVLRLGDRRVDSLMTPRTEITWLDLTDPDEVNRQKILNSNYSRYPAVVGSLDHVVGIVQARDLLKASLDGAALDLRGAMIAPLFVPDSMLALKVLELFRTERAHMALVIDEFGGFQGIVTTFDLLEAIVGALPEPGVEEDLEVIARPDGSFLIDGMMDIDDFTERFGIPILPGEEQGYFQTLGGFIMTQLGKIPEPADQFEWGGWLFEVMDMDGRRVDKVLLTPSPNRAPGERDDQLE
jgi:putative hemolysin